jgi:hypothetical protein
MRSPNEHDARPQTPAPAGAQAATRSARRFAPRFARSRLSTIRLGSSKPQGGPLSTGTSPLLLDQP